MMTTTASIIIPSKLRTSDVHRRGTCHVKGCAAKDRVEGQAADHPAAEPVHNLPAEPATTPPNLAEVRTANSPSAGPRQGPAATLPGSTPAGVATPGRTKGQPANHPTAQPAPNVRAKMATATPSRAKADERRAASSTTPGQVEGEAGDGAAKEQARRHRQIRQSRRREQRRRARPSGRERRPSAGATCFSERLFWCFDCGRRERERVFRRGCFNILIAGDESARREAPPPRTRGRDDTNCTAAPARAACGPVLTLEPAWRAGRSSLSTPHSRRPRVQVFASAAHRCFIFDDVDYSTLLLTVTLSFPFSRLFADFK